MLNEIVVDQIENNLKLLNENNITLSVKNDIEIKKEETEKIKSLSKNYKNENKMNVFSRQETKTINELSFRLKEDLILSQTIKLLSSGIKLNVDSEKSLSEDNIISKVVSNVVKEYKLEETFKSLKNSDNVELFASIVKDEIATAKEVKDYIQASVKTVTDKTELENLIANSNKVLTEVMEQNNEKIVATNEEIVISGADITDEDSITSNNAGYSSSDFVNKYLRGDSLNSLVTNYAYTAANANCYSKCHSNCHGSRGWR